MKITLDPSLSQNDRNMFRYDRMAGEWVPRKPYYYDPLTQRLLPHPFFCVLFSQFAFYRFFVGGVWFNNQGIWTRMEDRRSDEFCNEHCMMEPCDYCKAESELFIER